jgi:very-short-patch-repair endonuclease
MGACLWANAAAHGLAAGHLWELPGCDRPGIEILTPRSKIVPHAGVTVHFTSRLPKEQLTVIDGIPVTSIERTLLGLSAAWGERRLAIAIDDAFRRGLTDPDRIDEFLRLTARRGRNGVKALRKLAKQRAGLDVLPDTPLETLIWQLIVDSDLPLPECQFVIRDRHGIFVARVDFFYPDRDLVIEGQSYKWHTGLHAWLKDVDRFNALSELGYRVIQLKWEDVTTKREATVRRLRALFS